MEHDTQPRILHVPPLTREVPEEKTKTIRLTSEQKYAVYCFCVENGHIVIDKEKVKYIGGLPAVAYHVRYAKIVPDVRVSGANVKSAVENSMIWLNLTERLPTPPQSSVQENRLSAENTKLQITIDDQQAYINKQTEQIKHHVAVVMMYRERIASLRQILAKTPQG